MSSLASERDSLEYFRSRTIPGLFLNRTETWLEEFGREFLLDMHLLGGRINAPRRESDAVFLDFIEKTKQLKAKREKP